MKKIITFILNLFRGKVESPQVEEALTKPSMRKIHVWFVVSGYEASWLNIELEDREVIFKDVGRTMEKGATLYVSEIPPRIDFTVVLKSDTDSILCHTHIDTKDYMINGNVFCQLTEKELHLVPITFDAVVSETKES